MHFNCVSRRLKTKHTGRLVKKIASKKVIERALRRSEKKYRELFETSLDGIAIVDLSGNFIECNPAFLKMIGYSSLKELGGKTFWDITPAEYHELEREQIEKKVLIRGYSDEFEKEYETKDGKRIFVSIRIWLRQEGDDLQRTFWALVRDITELKQLSRSFIQTEQNFRSIIENSQDGMILLDSNGRVIEWNPGMELITGLKKSQVVGHAYWDIRVLLAPDNLSNWDGMNLLKELLPILLRENQDQLPEIKIKRPDGIIRTVQIRTFTIDSEKSKMFGGIVRDVTEQVASRESLRRYAERLKVLYEIDRDILKADSLKNLLEVMMNRLKALVKCQRASIIVFKQGSSEPYLLYVNDNTETKWGSGKQLTAKNYQIPTGFASGKEYLVTDLLKEDQLPEIYRDLAQEGIRSYFSLPLIAQGELVGSINLGAKSVGYFNEELCEIIRQIGNHFAIAIYQTRLHEQLEKSREQLRWLSQSLVSVQEEERRRLSRELHDEVGQELTALKIMLDLTLQDLPPEYSLLRSRVEESINLTNSTLEKIRSLAKGLRPPALDVVGLGPALEDLCNSISKRTGLFLNFKADPIPNLPESLNICLYRVLQEILTNIAKHAKARRVEVQLIKESNSIYLIVEDDGVGFEESVQKGLIHKGIGIIGMQERIKALGGELQIQTRKGDGTRIIAMIPWGGDYQ